MNFKVKKALSLMLATTMLSTSIFAMPTFASEDIDFSISAFANTVSINKAEGWLESAYALWNPYAGATSYNVYYRAADSATYTKVDKELIRTYPNDYRVDVVGLKAGNYVLKIVPVINEVEQTAAAAETGTLVVAAHQREGYAFDQASPNKTGSGGYNNDGTAPANAQILYITDATKDTVNLSVITDSKGKTTACTGIAAIMKARQKGYDKTPLIVRYIGTVTAPAEVNSSNYLEVKGCYNVTMEGIGEDAVTKGWSFLVRDANNAEIRNFGIMWFKDDGISLDTDNYNIWIHNNDFFYGERGGDADQAKGDGSLDTKKSIYVTLSYNHFWDSGKSSLCGMGEAGNKTTYHHNWFDHSDSRHPRVRDGNTHVFNNYFDGNSKYGIGNTTGGSILSEGNFFRNCKYPMLISLQGSDIYNSGDYRGKGTFSSEPGGIIKSFNNHIEWDSNMTFRRFVDQNDMAGVAGRESHFDAYTVVNQKDKVPSSITAVNGGATYNNFDTDASMYPYTLQTPEAAKATILKYAGRINGGDFSWTFNNAADDTSYDINEALYSALRAYTGKLITDTNYIPVTTGSTASTVSTTTESTSETTTISGTTNTTVSTSVTTTESTTETTTISTTEKPTETTTAPLPGYIWNPTAGTNTNSFFTVSGNEWSDAKNNVQTYNGLTLSKAYKMESATKFAFTAPSAGKLVLVVYATGTPKIKLDGTDHSLPLTGVYEISNVTAGYHELTKNTSSTNVFYIEFVPNPPVVPTITYGEIDGDGFITANDAAMVLQYVLNSDILNLSEDQKAAADVDGDGVLTANDAAAIMQKALNSNFQFLLG